MQLSSESCAPVLAKRRVAQTLQATGRIPRDEGQKQHRAGGGAVVWHGHRSFGDGNVYHMVPVEAAW